MSGYDESLSALSEALESIAKELKSLSAEEWTRPTQLVPVGPVPRWTVLELAGHLGYAMNMVDTLLANGSASPPELDRVSFYDLPRDLVAPLAHQTAVDVVAGKTSAQVLRSCLASFSDGMGKARLADPEFVGSTVIGTIRVDEFMVTRVIEAVVHGLDLAQALDRPMTPSSAAVDYAADVLDSLNRRTRNAARPDTLADNWLWVQVASGRRYHVDFPVPLLG